MKRKQLFYVRLLLLAMLCATSVQDAIGGQVLVLHYQYNIEVKTSPTGMGKVYVKQTGTEEDYVEGSTGIRDVDYEASDAMASGTISPTHNTPFDFKCDNVAEGYMFLGWSNNAPATKLSDIVSTDNPATFDIESTKLLYSQFGAGQTAPEVIPFDEDYKQEVYANLTCLQAVSEDIYLGSAAVESERFLVDFGEEVTLQATVVDAKLVDFLGWKYKPFGDNADYGNDYVSTQAQYTITTSQENAGYYMACFSVKDGVQLDNDNAVCLPASASSVLMLSEDSPASFTIYDSGGPNGNYGVDDDGSLLLIAPKGRVLQLTGSADLASGATLTVYDGMTDDAALLATISSSSDPLSSIVSTGRYMRLRFQGGSSNAAGLNLTGAIGNRSDITVSNGTCTVDKNFVAKDEADRTVKVTKKTDDPDHYYFQDNPIITDVNGDDIEVNRLINEFDIENSTLVYSYTMPQSNVVIDANIVPSSCGVRFVKNSDDAKGTMDDWEVVYLEEDPRLPACTFTREGYTFAGWNTKADGTGTHYASGASLDYDGAKAIGESQGWVNYYVHLYAEWNEDLKYGAVTIMDNGSIRMAVIDGSSSYAVDIPTDVAVGQVFFVRNFSVGKPSTVILPFSINASNVSGAEFYTFAGVEKVAGEWTCTMNEVATTLTANTPYLLMPTAANVQFDAPEGGFTLNTTGGGSLQATSGDWQFVGTYTGEQWEEAPTGVYGFSAQNTADGISQGEFVKVGAKVRVRPLRAYLRYKDGMEDFAAARTLAGETVGAPSATADEPVELPETIRVRLVDSNGDVEGIGVISTKTGTVSFDPAAWYTTDGVRLGAKPNEKGVYINNGRKVVIK